VSLNLALFPAHGSQGKGVVSLDDLGRDTDRSLFSTPEQCSYLAGAFVGKGDDGDWHRRALARVRIDIAEREQEIVSADSDLGLPGSSYQQPGGADHNQSQDNDSELR